MDRLPVIDMAGIRELFERHALRCTRQREQIYEALACTKSHPTADELFQAVRASEPGLSLATIYNTLDAFTECGLVRRLPCPSGSGPCRYDADVSDHVHMALRDGRLVDLPHDLSGQLLASVPAGVLKELERRFGVHVAGLNMQVLADPAPNGAQSTAS